MRFGAETPAAPPAWYRTFRRGMVATFLRQGHELGTPDDSRLRLFFHLVRPHRPRAALPERRKAFSVGVVALEAAKEDLLAQAYPLLVRTLSDLLVVLPGGDVDHPWLVTPELGCYPVRRGEGSACEDLYRALMPLAASHRVVRLRAVPDPPPDSWRGAQATRELAWARGQVEALGLAPRVPPVAGALSLAAARQIQRLYGVDAFSRSSFSIRHDEDSFWLSSSPVPPDGPAEVGRDVLFVHGYDPEREAMVVSVPPGVRPRRASRAAVLHWLVYRRLPEVGAMVHLHTSTPGAPSTTFPYPCGTREFGEELAAALEQLPDPASALIALANHGLTATGRDFYDILSLLGRHLRSERASSLTGTPS